MGKKALSLKQKEELRHIENSLMHYVKCQLSVNSFGHWIIRLPVLQFS